MELLKQSGNDDEAAGKVLLLRDGRDKHLALRSGDILGRESAGQALLKDFEGISRKHAQVIFSNDVWHIVDLGSTNGTFVNGKRINPNDMTPVAIGDTLKLSKEFEAHVVVDKRSGQESEASASSLDNDSRTEMTIMFVDLKGSTDYFQEKGTLVASGWLNNFYKMLNDAISQYSGRHIKNIGDAILAVFESPNQAAKAAILMQLSTTLHNAKAPESEHYYIKIGVNTGMVLNENNDIFGNAVNITARIQSLAPAGHTYVSEMLYDRIQSDPAFVLNFVIRERLRGIKNEMNIYELLPATAQSKKSAATSTKITFR